MALVRLRLFPDKGEVWVNPDNVAMVRDGPSSPGQSGMDNSYVTLAGSKSELQVHGRAQSVVTALKAAQKR